MGKRTGNAVFRSAVSALALALSLGVSTPAAAQDRITRDEGRTLANQLLLSGQPIAARDITAALLTADPQDTVALILHSRAERMLGNLPEARAAARAAWAAADRPDLEFGAAIVRAEALREGGNSVAANLWYRRAADATDDEAASSYAMRELDTMRAETPLRVHLSFGITPRDNINNGGSNLTYAFHPDIVDYLRDYLNDPTLDPRGTLTEAERPLSGIEYRAGVTLRYRLNQTETSRTEATLRAHGRTYSLSDEAQALVPDATGSDYADASLRFGLTHTWRGEGPTHRLNAGAGVIWYGGDPYSRSLSLSYGLSWRLDDSVLNAEAALSRSWFEADRPEETDSSLSLAWRKPLDGGGSLTLTSALRDHDAEGLDRAYQSGAIGMGWNWNENPANSIYLGLERRDFERSFHVEGTRQDLITTLRVSVGVPQMETLGFQPVVTVEARDLSSNAERPETRSLGAGVSFISSF